METDEISAVVFNASLSAEVRIGTSTVIMNSNMRICRAKPWKVLQGDWDALCNDGPLKASLITSSKIVDTTSMLNVKANVSTLSDDD